MRIFLIGYEPPEWDWPSEPTAAWKRKIMELMHSVDVAAAVPGGWPVGEVMDVDGRALVCVEHEHDGKIVIAKGAPSDASN